MGYHDPEICREQQKKTKLLMLQIFVIFKRLDIDEGFIYFQKWKGEWKFENYKRVSARFSYPVIIPRG